VTNPTWLAVGLTFAAIAGESSASAQAGCTLYDPWFSSETVNLTHLNNTKNNFGGMSPPSLGDYDCDTDIDLTDLNIVKNNFGLAPPRYAETGISTPEPSSLLLAVAAGGASLFARRCW
jgi:hypothetical protein